MLMIASAVGGIDDSIGGWWRRWLLEAASIIAVAGIKNYFRVRRHQWSLLRAKSSMIASSDTMTLMIVLDGNNIDDSCGGRWH